MDLAEIRGHLRRSDWGAFPEVNIQTDVSVVKRHAGYIDAKNGSALAADALVDDVLALASVESLRPLIGDRRPSLLAVHAVETAGMNAIPRALARRLSKLLSLPLASGIIQINRVLHTGADGYHRLAFPPVFEGPVEQSEYLLVDDFIGQGGTLANLKGYVEGNGGTVIGAVVLSGKTYSATVRLSEGTLRGLRDKHGRELEEWWIATFGYGFEKLTESEARYIARSEDADTVRARLIAARGAGD